MRTMLVFLFCLSWARSAHAYLDPGTGSYIFQVALAAAFAGLYAVKLYWTRIKNWVGRLFQKK